MKKKTKNKATARLWGGKDTELGLLADGAGKRFGEKSAELVS